MLHTREAERLCGLVASRKASVAVQTSWVRVRDSTRKQGIELRLRRLKLQPKVAHVICVSWSKSSNPSESQLLLLQRWDKVVKM